jgi:PPM family protein phosphatase
MSDDFTTQTAEIVLPPEKLEAPEPYSSLVDVDVAGLSHQGKVRLNNEDHFLICRAGRFLETVLTNLPEDDLAARSEEIGYGMLVADGMGGTEGGEVASRLAITTMMNLILQLPDWIMRVDGKFAQEAMKRATLRYKQVDAEIGRQAAEDPKLMGMGTTMTAAYSIGADLFVIHVGDSRAYLLRDGRLHQLTRDQTLVQTLVDLGELTPEGASSHPLRHVLTHALGLHQGRVKVEAQRLKLRDGDCLLVCTDGLTEMAPNEQISQVLLRAEPAADGCRNLVDLALEKGGKDNITVIIARYRLPAKEPANRTESQVL